MSREINRHTWICNANANITISELCATQVKCLFQAFERSELDVAEALGLMLDLVFNDAHIRDFTTGKEVFNV